MGRDWEYQRFVGQNAPPETFGVTGDICYITDNPEEGEDKFLQARWKYELMAPGPIYVRGLRGQWVLIKPDFQGVNNTPVTKHPMCSRTCLDYALLVWSPIGTFSNKYVKQTRNNLVHSSRITLVPSSYIPQCINPANAWILQEYNHWKSPPISLITPVQDQGRRILAKLLQNDKELPMRPHAYSAIHTFTNIPKIPLSDIPGLEDIFIDLIALPPSKIQAVNFGTSAHRSGIPAPAIIASIVSACRNHKKWDLSDPLLGVLNLPASTKGLGRCKLEIPEYPKESNQKWSFKMNPQKPSQYNWSSSINPAGAITSPHIDYAGSGQHIFHCEGRKLWFLWPPTPSNLMKLNEQRLSESASELTIEAALDKLAGLELFLIEDPMVQFFLPANYIHAVMTFCTSCHTAVQVWGTSQFQATSELIKQIIEIVLQSKPGSLPDETIKYFTDFLWEFSEKELPQWKALGKLDSPDSKAILHWIEKFEKTLEHLPL